MINIKKYILSAVIFLSTSPIFGDVYGFIGSLILILAMMYGNFSSRKSAFLPFAVIATSMLPLLLYDIYTAFNSSIITYSHFVIFASVCLGYIVASSTSSQDYLNDFEQAFLPLAIASFGLYCIFWSAPDIAYYLSDYSYRDTVHRTAYMLNVLMNPDPVLRNAGFASEPGFYQILVNMALFTRINRLGHPDKICLLYLIIVISTLSTIGLIIALFLVAYKFDVRYRIYIGAFVLIFWVPSLTLVSSQVETKINNEAVLGARVAPSINAIALLKDQPLGLGSVEYTRVFESLDIGSFDSYTQIGLRFGVFALLAFIILLFRMARRKFALAVLLGISFLTSPIWFNPIIVACLFFPLRATRNSALVKRRNYSNGKRDSI